MNSIQAIREWEQVVEFAVSKGAECYGGMGGRTLIPEPSTSDLLVTRLKFSFDKGTGVLVQLSASNDFERKSVTELHTVPDFKVGYIDLKAEEYSLSTKFKTSRAVSFTTAKGAIAKIRRHINEVQTESAKWRKNEVENRIRCEAMQEAASDLLDDNGIKYITLSVERSFSNYFTLKMSCGKLSTDVTSTDGVLYAGKMSIGNADWKGVSQLVVAAKLMALASSLGVEQKLQE